MRFKYKDLTIDSYIFLELYSMQLPEDQSLLGTTKIYLFDNNLSLGQGRHIFKLNKKEDAGRKIFFRPQWCSCGLEIVPLWLKP